MGTIRVKGVKGGIRLIIDEEASWKEVIDELKDKLGTSFFNEGKLFIELGRRKVSKEEYRLLDEILSSKPSLRIMRVEAFDPSTRSVVKEFLPHVEPETIDRVSLFHLGTLRSGAFLEHDGDLVIIGDVNPGAEVRLGGNLAVFGALRGSAYVGMDISGDVFVVALRLSPSLLVMRNRVIPIPSDLSKDKPVAVTLSEDGKVGFHIVKGG